MGNSRTNYKVLFATIMTSASTEPGMTEPEFVIAPKRLHSRSQFPATAFDFASPKEKLPLFPRFFAHIQECACVFFASNLYAFDPNVVVPKEKQPECEKRCEKLCRKIAAHKIA